METASPVSLQHMLQEAFPDKKAHLKTGSMLTMLTCALLMEVTSVGSITRLANDPRFAGWRWAWGLGNAKGPHVSTIYKLIPTLDFSLLEEVMRNWLSQHAVALPNVGKVTYHFHRYPGLARYYSLLMTISDETRNNLVWRILEDGGFHKVHYGKHLYKLS